jgi:ABC-type transporter Mla MlaB component
MTKEDSAPGLLSKMVKFVRNPATSWSDLDNKDTDRDEAMSKQVLKDMIERKRRNDFVRKREFDMLRKMRKREAMVGQDPGARPSFFQSSMPSKPDDRAQTLKKIDEIEAQMSMQWWQTKPRTSLAPGGNTTLPPLARRPTAADPSGAVSSMPAGYASTQVNSLHDDAGPVTPKTPAQQRPMVAGASLPVVRPPEAAPLPSGGSGFGKSAFGFGTANYMAVEVEELAHDAELEEAAIRFANSDDTGAEIVLLEMLALTGSRVDNPETWMALFDLYRVTDQKDKFENTAIDFVRRFDRSAPQWFSMLDMVRQLVAAEGKAPANSAKANWICPSTVGIQTVAALKVALAKAAMPWCLDWSNLKAIDVAAVESLCKVFSNWSAQPVQLRFLGDAHLQKILQNATPSGQRETPQEWWHLRMEALRITHRPDEFELAALDFCVTYEVSPPAWESARCEYKALDPEDVAVSGQTIIGDAYRDSLPSILSVMEGDTQMDSLDAQVSRFSSVELSGQIHGDAVAVLEQLEDKLKGADILMISCAKLIRVDFSAAGTLLNWVSAREAENRSVQFADVNRLVAAFFNVIGITEHAKVMTRRD